MSIDYRPDNTIIFTLARMNPPTPGHLYVIQKLIEEGINKNAEKVYVILSKTNDNNENPIPCSEKINILGSPEDVAKTMIQSIKEKMKNNTNDEDFKRKIDNIIVETICVPEVVRATPFTPLFSIVGEKNEIPDLNLFLIIGDDRANMLDSITDTMFKRENVNSIDGLILDRPNMGEFKKISSNPQELASLNISQLPVGALSASLVRNLVKNNRRDKFNELYSPYLEQDKIDKLYEDIEIGLLHLPNKKVKKESQSKESSQRIYPLIKGVGTLSSSLVTKRHTTIGGRKTNKKRNKKTCKKRNKKTNKRRNK